MGVALGFVELLFNLVLIGAGVLLGRMWAEDTWTRRLEVMERRHEETMARLLDL